MRDATGSAWVFAVCILFILLFTAYLAISINYAKAFRIKNHIIDKIEENEGYNEGIAQTIDEYLDEQGYDAYGVCDPYIKDEGSDIDWQLDECLQKGDIPTDRCSLCLYRKNADKQDDPVIRAKRSYYRVVAFFRFDLPVIKTFMPSFQVAGESRYIYDFANGES